MTSPNSPNPTPQTEREMIVAWLRAQAKTLASWPQAQAVGHYANRIEKGDYLSSVHLQEGSGK